MAASTPLIEHYIPFIQYHGFNTDKNVDIGGTLTADGNATLGGTLAVTGASTLSGAVTAESTLAVTGAVTLSSTVNYKRQVTDTGGAYATPVVLTTAQSGRNILVDDAAGLDFTLPAIAAADVGTWFKFLVSVTITSNNFRFTAASGDLLRGGLWAVDFDQAITEGGTFFEPDESDDLICTMNGTTTGGKKGTVVTITAITATGWFVEGIQVGDGVLATPFS